MRMLNSRFEVSPSVAAKWRAMTINNLNKLQERNEMTFPAEVATFLISKVSAFIAIAGFQDIPPDLTKQLKSNLEWMAKSTLQIRTVIIQQVSLGDTEVLLVRPGCDFDPGVMTDDSDNGVHSASGGEVFCTMDLGLRSS